MHIQFFNFEAMYITQPQFDLQLRNLVVALAYHYTNMRESVA